MGKERSYRIALAVLVIFHIVGVAGILSPWRETFVLLSPLNLMLTAGLIYSQEQSSKKTVLRFFIVCLVIGFLAEFLGVQTGFPFGSYSYGSSLGPKLGGVPLVIGVNWFIVAIGAKELAIKLFRVRGFQIFGAALLMVALDFLIEPVAIQIDFWTWEGGNIPLSNYLGWVAVGFLLQFIWDYWMPKPMNPLAIPVLIVQSLFFITLLLFL